MDVALRGNRRGREVLLELYCVVKKSRKEVAIETGWLIKAMIVCLFIGGSCVGYLWQKSQVHKLGQRIQKLERELDHLERGNERLRQRYSTLRSQPELKRRLAEWGSDLREPSPEQIHRIRETNDEQEVLLSGEPAPSKNRYSKRD